jgi:antibiotic biosynthesis monooxygenase (ABM) superfamily enzyme
MSGAGETDGADGPVTVLVARRVVPGREVEFERWASELTRAASAFDGFLGAGLLRPGHVGELWHVVYRFASADELARWEHSQTRSELLAHGEQVMSTSHERRMTGLETWFEVPGRTAPAPPRWKMFLVTSVVIFVLQLMLNLVLYRVVSAPIALVPRVAFISFSVSALMTWVVQPQLARLLEGWLYAPRRSR